MLRLDADGVGHMPPRGQGKRIVSATLWETTLKGRLNGEVSMPSRCARPRSIASQRGRSLCYLKGIAAVPRSFRRQAMPP